MENRKRHALSIYGWTSNARRGDRERWRHSRGKIGWLTREDAYKALYTGNDKVVLKQRKDFAALHQYQR